jgi:hypothetical protein
VLVLEYFENFDQFIDEHIVAGGDNGKPIDLGADFSGAEHQEIIPGRLEDQGLGGPGGGAIANLGGQKGQNLVDVPDV